MRLLPESARNVLARLNWGLVFRLSARRTITGVQVGCPPGERDAEGRIFAKLGAALRLIEIYAPEDLARLRRLVDRLLVHDGLGGQGEWDARCRMVCLRTGFVMGPTTDDAHVAATLVHEVTHAWLESYGFRYREDRRGRIESICYRRQAAFARRIPGGDPLAVYYEGRAADALVSDEWAPAAFIERQKRALARAGVPRWAIAMFARKAHGAPANDR